MKLKLLEPVKIGEHGNLISEIDFREKLCGGDLRGIKVGHLTTEMTTDDLFTLASRLSGQPDLLFTKYLGTADVFRVLETVGNFYMAGLETGNAPSP